MVAAPETELRTVYTAALLMTGTPEYAEACATSAYRALESGLTGTRPTDRMQWLMAEAVMCAKSIALASARASTSAPNESKTRVSLFRNRIGMLNFDQRVAVVLADVCGFSSEEAASVVGLTRGQFRKRLSEGRVELHERVS